MGTGAARREIDPRRAPPPHHHTLPLLHYESCPRRPTVRERLPFGGGVDCDGAHPGVTACVFERIQNNTDHRKAMQDLEVEARQQELGIRN